MLETLILYTLLERNLTIYAVRKYILQSFSIFLKPSLGAIYPAIKRLEKKGYIEASSTFTEGGQKSVFHKLTISGKKYFFNYWTEILSQTLPKCTSEIKMKIIMLPQIKDNETKKIFFENAISQLDFFLDETKNIMSKRTDGYFLTSAGILYKECSELIHTIEKIKKES